MAVSSNTQPFRLISPRLAFLLVSFTLGQLGDGLNIFQGVYLNGIGWNPGSVGLALSLMGLTSLIVQTWAGDIVDKTSIDRRLFLTAASIVTALSASAILFVPKGNHMHGLIYTTKVIEGIASSFIGPCLAALTLATYGPKHFDAVMASNILWGHIGTLLAAVLAGAVAYIVYPNIKFCFLVIGGSALFACGFVQYMPEGNPLMGRGFDGEAMMDEFGHAITEEEEEDPLILNPSDTSTTDEPVATSYLELLKDKRIVILAMSGFFFHFANANVLLVLGELMATSDDCQVKRSGLPLTAANIVLAQLVMSIVTWAGERLTLNGVGRKPLFLCALLSLPIRCALIVFGHNAGNTFLVSTQVLDGVGGGFFGLIHPYLIADITYNTGRFNFLMGLTASCFGVGATLSNYLGQLVVQYYGPIASLSASMCISIIPILLFGCLMPETRGARTAVPREEAEEGEGVEATNYEIMA